MAQVSKNGRAAGGAETAWALRIAAIVGTAALWPALFNQLLFPMTFTYYTTHDYTAYSFSFVYSLLMIAIAVVLSVVHRKTDGLLLNNGRLVALFGVFGSAGIFAISQCDFSSTLNMIILGIGVAAVALYVSTHFLFWSLHFAQRTDRAYISDMALSFALFALLSGLRLTLGIHSTEVSIVCPLISTACAMYVALKQREAAAIRTAASLELKSLPWNFLVPCLIFLVLCTAVTIIFRQEVGESVQPAWRNIAHLTLAVCCLALAVIYWPRGTQRKGTTLGAFVLVSLAVIGGVLTSLLTAQETFTDGSVPMIVANGVLNALMWLLIIREANRRHASPTSVTALYLAVCIVLPRMVRAAAVYQTTLVPRGEAAVNLFIVIGVTAFAAVTIAVVALLRFFTSTELAEQTDETQEAARTVAFEKLGEAFELTERELEVARALGEYSTAEELANALFIAESTARTHIKRIYRKCGVHSKAEFAALVEEYRTR